MMKTKTEVVKQMAARLGVDYHDMPARYADSDWLKAAKAALYTNLYTEARDDEI